ncbi:MAG: alpha-L-rhamnosidase C-terminal domain-containing protein [Bilifractor sp.]|jgi:alpha-L-rhamnosidase
MNENRTNWIWTPDWNAEDSQAARIVYFRKAVFAEKRNIAEQCRIRITADSHYKLYVNGHFVQDGPQKSLDLKEWFVDEADLNAYLTEGQNVVAVEVLRYPEPNLSFGVPVSNDSLLRSPIPNLYVEQIRADGDSEAEGLNRETDGNPESESLNGGTCGDPEAEGLNGGTCGDPEARSLDGRFGWKCLVNRGIQIVDEDSMPAPIHAQEIVHATGSAAGWMEPGFDDTAWAEARAMDAMEMPKSDAPGNLVPRTIPYLRYRQHNFAGVKEIREVSVPVPARASAEHTKAQIKDAWEKMLSGTGSVEVPAHSRVVVEISADVEECGFLNYAMSGGRGAVIRTLCSECYAYPPEKETDANGIPQNPVKGDRTDSVNGRLFGHTSVYHPAGCGTPEQPEVYEPFWFRTFRFIQLQIETGEDALRILKFAYRETGYPLEVHTTVKTSDPTLAPVWDISLRTLERCMRDTYMDCPFYEQLQYAMDSREEILYTYSVSADDRLARQAIEAFRRSQRPDGMINASAPAQKSNVIPGFSIYYLLMVYDHMMYFGDRALVEENWNAIDQVLAFFDRNLGPNGMVNKIGGPLLDSRYWSFIDWTREWNATMGVPTATAKGSGQLTMESLLYVYGLQKAAKISDFAERHEAAERYRRRAGEVLEAVREHAMGVCGDVRLVQDGPGVDAFSVHTQVFAVLTGLTDPREGRKMLEETVGNSCFPQASVSYMFYLFRALEITGLYDRTDALWELWRKMVREHMSTCVENGVDGRSDCHAWASLILYEIPATVLGVRPSAPGYASVRIAPVAGYLTEAAGDVITPRGTVHVEWKKGADGTLKVDAKAPEGVSFRIEG